MSGRAVAYVQGLPIADDNVRQVFMLLAARTETSRGDEGPEAPMGLLLNDADIPQLAATVGLAAPQFRQVLRSLRRAIPMDVLEHPDGVWEIVYGPTYTRSRPSISSAFTNAQPGPVEGFWYPGWDHLSTWGHDEGTGCLYAQLYHNSDDRDAAPGSGSPHRGTCYTPSPSWLRPSPMPWLGMSGPRPPAAIIKAYLKEPPASRR